MNWEEQLDEGEEQVWISYNSQPDAEMWRMGFEAAMACWGVIQFAEAINAYYGRCAIERRAWCNAYTEGYEEGFAKGRKGR